MRSTITLLSVKASFKARLAAQRLHFCACDGWVRCSNEAWLLLEVVVTGEKQSIFNEEQFYRGLECQDRDGAFHFLFDVEGQCRDTILFNDLVFSFFLITKKVGAVSGTNVNHFRYFGLGPKCTESGVANVCISVARSLMGWGNQTSGHAQMVLDLPV